MPLALPLHLLADDLTGALDSAAALGPGVPVWLDQPAATPARTPWAVVATASRDLPPTQLPAALQPCLGWLADAGLAFKKVDSLLRGNTLAEVAWLARAGGFAQVVLAPAFPAQGRYTLGGRLAVAPAGAAASAAEARGEPLAHTLQRLDWPSACALHLPDVRSDADLDALVARVAQTAHTATGRTLWCGSAGLAQALARQLGAAQPAGLAQAPPADPALPAADLAPPGAGLWVVGASHQASTRRQWAHAAAAYPQALRVVHADPAAWDRALTTLAQATARPTLALLDLSPLHALDAAAAQALLHRQVAQLAALPSRPARLLVLGGDTARALCQATGVQALASGQPGLPGWGQARWHGGRWHGLWMDCRSGAFGDDADLTRAIERIAQAGVSPAPSAPA